MKDSAQRANAKLCDADARAARAFPLPFPSPLPFPPFPSSPPFLNSRILIGGRPRLISQNIPIPAVSTGRVLIRIHACGLNRLEMFTRQGHSPGINGVPPRVLGIEAVGVVAECPGGEFEKGEIVSSIGF